MNARRKERGVAAVEAALLMSLTALLLLPGMLYVGRMTWHATALHKAVYGASRIIAALPQEAMVQYGASARLNADADAYVRQAARDAGIDMPPATGMTGVRCDNVNCGAWLPQDVTVDAAVHFSSTLRAPGWYELATPNVNMAVHYTVSYAP
ncbi:pilus assembly protein [[Empedobacter] haloabium]|uniref:Pilus assembly protein n=1 Tax=[Empedobacter] haloabium TaxID=592317 RepID=A0ABZ1UK78_9BURK